MLSEGAVVSVEKGMAAEADKIVKLVVESGTVTTINVPIAQTAGPVMAGNLTIQGGDVSLSATQSQSKGKPQAVRLLAPAVVLSGTKHESGQFGVEGVPVTLKPGVQVQASEVQQQFNPSQFNPDHTQYIARSREAKPIAVNMYCGFWTLMLCLVVTIVVSLFTTPKPDAELKNLVRGLTPLPREEGVPWYERPMLWAALLAAAFVAINILFW
jgi:hypothetical protein